MPPTLYLIDGHAVAYRQFFGLPVTSFTTPQGEPTNAVFGFTRILLDILEKDKPDYLAVSFDRGLSGREDFYAEYKGTRDKMPDELSVQMERIQQLVAAFNIPVLALDGYEADDIIGTVTGQARAERVQVRVITGDRDLLQLLEEGVEVQLPQRNAADVIYDVATFVEKYGLQPAQLVDMKALMGDPSDNIPGVKGIGEKTATKLLQQFGTLDAIYAQIESIKGANRKKLEANRDMAYLSQELARIRQDVPIDLVLADCVAHEFNVNAVLDLFHTLNFRTLRQRLIAMTTPKQGGSMFSDADFDDMPLFTDEDFSPPPVADRILNTITVRDADVLAALVERLNVAPIIAVDTETTSVHPMTADLVGISLAVDDQDAYYIPVGHTEGTQLPVGRVLDALRPPLTNPAIGKAMHNAAFDLLVLRRAGLDVTPIPFDTQLAEWIVDPDSRDLGLKNLVPKRLFDEAGRAVEMKPIKDLIGTGRNQRSFAEVPISEAASYAAADAGMTYRLVTVMQPLVERLGLIDLYNTLELPLIPVINAMEQAGVALDVAQLSVMSEDLDGRLKALEREIHDLSGGYGPFNINSPKQLNDVLFGKLGLPTQGIKKTTHGYSTNAAVLEGLRGAHPIIDKLLHYRELSKLKGTYVDALPELINPHTGRVHTIYNQTGTATGRLSSSDPNLQNIPIRTEVGREVRRAFIAPAGHLLLGVDYSQVELRVLAHVSRDPTLMQAFRQGQDIHKATAAAVFDIALHDVTYEQRSFAKRINFGLIYGMGAYRLARDSDMSFEEAKRFIEVYFDRLPMVKAYLEQTKRDARGEYGLKTLFDRRRLFPALIAGSGGRQAMQAEERAAINFPIQGSAADIIKRAMIDIHAALQREKLGAQMIMQVHDELVLEVPESEIDETKALVATLMEGAYPLDPPLVANAEVGKNWRDMDPA